MVHWRNAEMFDFSQLFLFSSFSFSSGFPRSLLPFATEIRIVKGSMASLATLEVKTKKEIDVNWKTFFPPVVTDMDENYLAALATQKIPVERVKECREAARMVMLGNLNAQKAALLADIERKRKRPTSPIHRVRPPSGPLVAIQVPVPIHLSGQASRSAVSMPGTVPVLNVVPSLQQTQTRPQLLQQQHQRQQLLQQRGSSSSSTSEVDTAQSLMKMMAEAMPANSQPQVGFAPLSTSSSALHLIKPIPIMPSQTIQQAAQVLSQQGSVFEHRFEMETGTGGELRFVGVDGRSPKKTRGNLPKTSVSCLKDWLFSHVKDPYPSEEEKKELAEKAHITVPQLNNWFINARRRVIERVHSKWPRETFFKNLGDQVAKTISLSLSLSLSLSGVCVSCRGRSQHPEAEA